MKKAFFIALLLILVLSFISTVYALTDPKEIIAQQTGINPEQINNIPKTPEEIQQLYLKQAWSELIAKNKYLGPVNSFLISISPAFLILFGENYSISPTLLAVIILWMYFALEINSILDGVGVLNSWANKAISIGISIILAQIGLFRGISTFLSNLVYSKDLWWVRLLILLGIFVAMFIVHYIMKIVEKQMKTSKKESKENKVEEQVKVQGEFIKGIKEGMSLGK